MTYQIKYKDQWTGKESVHTYEGNEAGAGLDRVSSIFKDLWR
jgi:glutamate synthase domain-containing protein 1